MKKDININQYKKEHFGTKLVVSRRIDKNAITKNGIITNFNLSQRKKKLSFST